MADSDVSFEDGETFVGGGYTDKISFKDIVLNHVRKISAYASVEFRGGFYDEKEVFTGNMSQIIRTYVPDTREVYSNAVEYLADLLYPHFDKEMLEAEENCKKQIEKVFNSRTVVIEESKEELHPGQEPEKYRRFDKIANKVSFRTERREINRKLFRHLCSFLYRKKYLEMGTLED